MPTGSPPWSTPRAASGTPTPSAAVGRLREALALWREDVAYADARDDLVAAERPRLHELRDGAVELLASLLLNQPDPGDADEAGHLVGPARRPGAAARERPRAGDAGRLAGRSPGRRARGVLPSPAAAPRRAGHRPGPVGGPAARAHPRPGPDADRRACADPRQPPSSRAAGTAESDPGPRPRPRPARPAARRAAPRAAHRARRRRQEPAARRVPRAEPPRPGTTRRTSTSATSTRPMPP